MATTPKIAAQVLEKQTHWPQLLLRALASVVVSALFIWLLSVRLAHIDLVDLRDGIEGVSLVNWLGAGLATMLSFWALGHYDTVLHRHFATNLPEPFTRRAGICAIAVSQTIGLGVISGAILRWRMLPGQSLWLAARLTTAVALSFLAGWAVVTALVLQLLPEAPYKSISLVALGVAAAIILICMIAPLRKIHWPNGVTIFRLLGLTAIDTLAAAFAFYLLCPDTLSLPFATFLPAFLLAFGAGLVSGTPGGVGPFEMTLLALLPKVAETPLVAAVLAWRVIYYAIPALIGAVIAIKGTKAPPQPACAKPVLLSQSLRSEVGLIFQGQHHLLAIPPQSAWVSATTPHCLIGLFDPIAGPNSTAFAIKTLKDIAKARSLIPVLYKANPRSAATARGLGLTPLRIAQEAWLAPSQYHLKTPARSGLRRKLRHAESASVQILCPAQHHGLDWTALDRIAADWAATHGGERGFSMGRYDRRYVQRQRLYIAYAQDRPIAFVTFHANRHEWALDLMRHGADLPDGSMHLLIHHAILDAKNENIARLSLAAVPDFSGIGVKAKTGLCRFKSSFAPHWQPLYLLAPNRAAIALAAAEIAREIHFPPILRTFDDDHADYGFATTAPSWHRQKE